MSAPIDPFLHDVLKEAGITGEPRRALVQAFPTMDDLLSTAWHTSIGIFLPT